MHTFGSMKIEFTWEGDILHAQVVCYFETVERPYETMFSHEVREEDFPVFLNYCFSRFPDLVEEYEAIGTRNWELRD